MSSTFSSASPTPSFVIKLDQFLKLQGLATTGGQAKWLIQDGYVEVDGTIETRRGRKLFGGEVVSVEGETYTVDPSSPGGEISYE
jgi:ribosome-associated protein